MALHSLKTPLRRYLSHLGHVSQLSLYPVWTRMVWLPQVGSALPVAMVWKLARPRLARREAQAPTAQAVCRLQSARCGAVARAPVDVRLREQNGPAPVRFRAFSTS